MATKDRIKWIENTLLPRLLALCPCWHGCVIAESAVKALQENTDNWASTLYFVKLTLTRDDETLKQDVVVKVIPDDMNLRRDFNSEKQFANEINFYETILLFFSSIRGRRNGEKSDRRFSESWYPKYFYSCLRRRDAEDLSVTKDDGIVVLADLKADGYELGPRKSLDYAHCRLAMEEIGRLHGMSYVGKLMFSEEFRESVVKQVEETMYALKDPVDDVDFMKITLTRVLDIMNAENDPKYSESLKRLNFTEHSMEFMKKLVQPQEPLAVLCHGDFCRNNMMFRYGDGQPVEVKLLDFQTIRYASPAIDLSFFLYMNTTPQLRRDHQQDLFQSYHSSVMRTMKEYLDDVPSGFDLEAFLKDFREHAVYGFMVASFFLPWMLSPQEETDELNLIGTEHGISSLVFANASAKLGGERLSRKLVDIAKELMLGGCI